MNGSKALTDHKKEKSLLKKVIALILLFFLLQTSIILVNSENNDIGVEKDDILTYKVRKNLENTNTWDSWSFIAYKVAKIYFNTGSFFWNIAV